MREISRNFASLPPQKRERERALYFGYHAEYFSVLHPFDKLSFSFVEITDLGDSGFPYLGDTKDTIYVGSNGYITLDAGDFSYMVGEVETQESRSLAQSRSESDPVEPRVASAATEASAWV